LALRGDPPRGQAEWVKCDNGFSHAIDLVRYIRKEYGDYFCISVAGYPEGHIDNPDPKEDMCYLKAKVDAGADYIVTKLFYDVDMFLQWLKDLKDNGINVPVLPGIMPIQSYQGFKRMTQLCKTLVPKKIQEALEPIKDDDQAVKEYGVSLAVETCKRLRDEGGISNFHFYTLNLEKSVRLILEGLEFVADRQQTKQLPWQTSLAKSREKENVRPIFWKNRMRSYVRRTESWDEYPNGRWGDSRSPAFGELDGYGISIKWTNEEALKVWQNPTSFDDVKVLFSKYCSGAVSALPWSDQPLSGESDLIRQQLVHINLKGYLTINSQPAVNGRPSADKVFGWGPKNGYIYQKAYLEIFVSPTVIDSLLKALDRHPTITYYAVDKNTENHLITNCPSDSPNAVTWGVFPGKEILQPTIVEESSFLAWKVHNSHFIKFSKYQIIHLLMMCVVGGFPNLE
jgi:methylenetetrahydrofolate reductase (NADPH)